MSSLELPYWLLVVLEISKGLMTPVITAFGIWIARNQLVVNRQKLKLDLFEKRYAVYECIRKCYAKIVREGAAEYDVLGDFDIGTNDAPFLFDRDVVAYIEAARKRLVDFAYHSRAIRGGAPYENSSKHVETETELLKSLNENLNGLQNRFQKYLAFKNS